MLFRWLLLLAQYVDLDVRLFYAAVQNLVYGRGNIVQTTAESSDTQPIFVFNMCSNPSICPSSFPQA